MSDGIYVIFQENFIQIHKFNKDPRYEYHCLSLYVAEMGTIVQYILVRGDLLLREGWPVGAVLAQACHAATAAIHLHYRDTF